jgi:putative oxidoreductase
MSSLCDLARNYAPLGGRILLAILFLQSGWHKIFDFENNAQIMAGKGIPLPEVLLALTIVLVVAGGLMIMAGWYARWAALALFFWMIPATLLYHAFWAAEPAQFFNQTNHFLKNLAIAGALLHLIGMGPGPFSLHAEKCGADMTA